MGHAGCIDSGKIQCVPSDIRVPRVLGLERNWIGGLFLENNVVPPTALEGIFVTRPTPVQKVIAEASVQNVLSGAAQQLVGSGSAG